MDYIKYIRSKVGHDKIILNFVGGILSNQQKILLQKRADKQTWGLPGGAIELGESAYEALIREFQEETGIAVKPIKLQNVYTKYEDSYPNGDQAQTIAIVYVVEAQHDINIDNFTNEETIKLQFFDYNEILKLEIVNQQHKDIIQDYFENNISLKR